MMPYFSHEPPPPADRQLPGTTATPPRPPRSATPWKPVDRCVPDTPELRQEWPPKPKATQ